MPHAELLVSPPGPPYCHCPMVATAVQRPY